MTIGGIGKNPAPDVAMGTVAVEPVQALMTVDVDEAWNAGWFPTLHGTLSDVIPAPVVLETPPVPPPPDVAILRGRAVVCARDGAQIAGTLLKGLGALNGRRRITLGRLVEQVVRVVPGQVDLLLDVDNLKLLAVQADAWTGSWEACRTDPWASLILRPQAGQSGVALLWEDTGEGNGREPVHAATLCQAAGSSLRRVVNEAVSRPAIDATDYPAGHRLALLISQNVGRVGIFVIPGATLDAAWNDDYTPADTDACRLVLAADERLVFE